MNRLRIAVSALLLLLICAGSTFSAWAQDPIVVTSTAGSGPGTLRQAILDANANPGPDTITFDPDVFPPESSTTITLSANLPNIDGTAGATIDGTGADVIIEGIGGSTSIGLAFGPFAANLSGLVVRNVAIQDVRTGIDIGAENISDVIIDGVTVTNGTSTNATGIDLFGNRTLSNVLIENTTVMSLSGTAFNIYSIEQTSAVTFRNTTATGSQTGFNIGSNGLVDGLTFEGTSATENTRVGYNLYGGGGLQNIAANNTAANDNGTEGWYMSAEMLFTELEIKNSEAIGNTRTGIAASSSASAFDWLLDNNTMALNGGSGFSLNATDQATDIIITNNTITGNGTQDAHSGISFGGGAGNTPNVIANNVVSGTAGTGILVYNGWATLSENQTYDNGLLGIDLRPPNESAPYVTPNDPGDGDDGPNTLQNAPVLTRATSGSLTIDGTLASTPSTTFHLEFFASDACDPSGYGEGEQFLGFDETTTDDNGDAAFSSTFDANVALGRFITATATAPNGHTSEYSPCVEVTGGNTPPTASQITTPADGAEVFIGGAPGQPPIDSETPFTVEWTPSTDADGDDVSYTWELAADANFALLLWSQDTGATQFETTLGIIASVLDAAEIELGDSVTLYHRVTASDGDATTVGAVAEVTLVRGTLTATDEVDVPESYVLEANYPNPFNPQTTIRFTMPKATPVRLAVYDALGREVTLLVDAPLPAGQHEAVFDATELPSGVYLYRIEAGTFVQTRQMLLMK